VEPPVDQTVVLLRVTFSPDRWKKRLTNGVYARSAQDVQTLLDHESRWYGSM
jgi:hypothetical protein